MDIINEIAEHMRFCRDPHCRYHHHQYRAVSFNVKFTVGPITFTGENMSVTFQAGNSVVASPTHPVLADGSPSQAVLSAARFIASPPFSPVSAD